MFRKGWRGPQLKSLFRAFFLGMVYFFTSALTEPPFRLFWTLASILAKLVFKKCGENNLVQNLGRDHPKKCKMSCLVVLLNEKQGSSLAHFLYFSNPLNLLTNCAMCVFSGVLFYCPRIVVKCMGFQAHYQRLRILRWMCHSIGWGWGRRVNFWWLFTPCRQWPLTMGEWADCALVWSLVVAILCTGALV